jgi:hypothetical protein
VKTYPTKPDRYIATALIGDPADIEELQRFVENWDCVEVVTMDGVWTIEFHDMKDVPVDEVVSTVQSRFTHLLGAVAIATGQRIEVTVPSSFEEHGPDGVGDHLALIENGILSLGLGSRGRDPDARQKANQIYEQAASDYDVAEITRLLAGDPYWFDLRRAFEMMRREHANEQNSRFAKVLHREPAELEDLYNSLSQPGHDPKGKKGSKQFKKRDDPHSLDEATRLVREIARQLLT